MAYNGWVQSRSSSDSDECRPTRGTINNNNKEYAATARFSYNRSRRHPAMATSSYFMPTDSAEMDRLDYQHYLLLTVVGAKHLSPIKRPKRILDVGTGTGIWMLEMAADYPDCEFIGIDIAPLQPEAVLPANCQFRIKNVVDAAGIPYPDNTFDFIHHRLLLLGLTLRDWPDYIYDCVRTLNSGGWLEISEMAGYMINSGAYGERIYKIVQKLTQALDIEVSVVLNVDQFMERAQLQNISIEVFKIPIGSWGGQIGIMAWNNYRSALLSVAPLLASIEGVPESEIIALIDAAAQEVNNNQCYCEYYCYYGQKPLCSA
ncbi:S-adenosyl-L-methionine-dependent methyltransferase [Syncephalis plumigaleata]|nr:S-adenosyl-L-methionine-dependent methyltransferase [Syncephalis plumigaleata]